MELKFAPFAPGAFRRALTCENALLRHRVASQYPELCIEPQQGEAWFPLVYDEGRDERLQGFLVRVRVSNEHAEGAPIRPGTRDALLKWLTLFTGVSTAVLEDKVSELSIQLVGLPPKMQVVQESDGLACAIALISHLISRPPRFAPLVSASLVLEGAECAVRAVSNSERVKPAIVEVEAPGHRLWTPGSDLSSAAPLLTQLFNDDWRRALFDELETSPRSLVEMAMDYAHRIADGADWNRAEPLALEALELADVTQEPHTCAHALWLVGTAETHRGSASRGIERLVRAHELFKRPQGPGEDLPDSFIADEVASQTAIAMIDCARPIDAVELLEPRLTALENMAEQHRNKRWQKVLVQVAGTLRRALHFLGRFSEAERIQTELAISNALRSERARCYLDLAATQLSAGKNEAARRSLRSARENLRDAAGSPTTRGFIQVQEIRAGALEPPLIDEDTGLANWSFSPRTLKQFEGLVRDPSTRFNDTLVSLLEGAAPSPAHCLYVLRYVAERVQRYGDVPLREPWLLQMVKSVREQPAVRMGLTGEQALDALCAGDGSGWILISPY